VDPAAWANIGAMTTRVLETFRVALPEGFEEQAMERGAAFRSAAGEALSFAAAQIEGGGPDAQQRLLRDRLVQGAIKDVQRAACQPDLEVVLPLTKAPGAPGIETWNLVARSDADRLLAQAVVASDAAVAVIAFEGRNTRDAIARWFGVLESIRPA
jgi:hypothetical protein